MWNSRAAEQNIRSVTDNSKDVRARVGHFPLCGIQRRRAQKARAHARIWSDSLSWICSLILSFCSRSSSFSFFSESREACVSSRRATAFFQRKNSYSNALCEFSWMAHTRKA